MIIPQEPTQAAWPAWHIAFPVAPLATAWQDCSMPLLEKANAIAAEAHQA